MKCQHCGLSEAAHQTVFDRSLGRHVPTRCLDGDGSSWLPMRFDAAVPPGGWVCAVDECGEPCESEPCKDHGGGS